MARPGSDSREARRRLAARYLAGSGLEIEGRDRPLRVSVHAHVRYVDSAGTARLRELHPDLDEERLVPVDVVDDGRRLDTIETGSQDFIVATGFLERLDDPLAALEAHLERLVPGGVLFYAVPEGELAGLLLADGGPLAGRLVLEALERDGTEVLAVLRKAGGTGPAVPASAVAADDPHAAAQTGLDKLELEQALTETARERDQLRADAVANADALLRLRRSRGRRRNPLRRLRPEAAAEPVAPTAGESIPLVGLDAELDADPPQGVAFKPRLRVGEERAGGISLAPGRHVRWSLRAGPAERFEARVGINAEAWVNSEQPGEFAVRLLTPQGEELRRWDAQAGGARHGAPWEWVPLEFALGLESERDVVLELSAPGEASAGPRLWADPALIGPPARTETAASAQDSAPADDGDPPPPAPRAADQGPLISILMPVHNPPAEFLEEALEHIRAQTYAHWELCVCDDATTDPGARAVLARHAREEERMSVVRHEAARGIADATNAALALARGEFVALHDHDDVLASDALELVAGAIAAHPDADMVYTDNDHLLPSGRRFAPFRKPDWSPDLFRCTMYTCHLGTYRRALVEQLGGLRAEFDGAQDYDLVLRLTERGGRVVHVARIAHHWRSHAASAAAGEEAKPYAYEAGRRAIDEHLRRTAAEAVAEHGPRRGLYRVRHRAPVPAVDVVLALDARIAGDPGLDEALAGLARGLTGAQAPFRVLVAGPAGALEACERALRDGGVAGFEGIEADADAPFPELVGRAAAAGSAPLLLWLERPLEGTAPGWLEALAGHVSAEGVGAAGAKILGTAGRVERAGVVVSSGVPLTVDHGADGDDVGVGAGLLVTSNRSAVAGAVMTWRGRFDELGGLDASLGRFAEVDYCLRLRARGDRVVLVPDSVLRRCGVAPAPQDLAERRRFAARWGAMGADPYYNLAFWQARANHALRYLEEPG